MSCVILLAADHPLPLYDPGLRRISVFRAQGREMTLETPGFAVLAHEYYRSAVEMLGLEMKPYQYELNVEATEEEAALLRTYLEEHCSPGDQVELWNLWVGSDREAKVPSFRGRLTDLDAEALEQLRHPPVRNGCPGQCRMTVLL